MEKIQNRFVFFANFAETIQELPEEKQPLAYKAICEYGIFGKLPEDDLLKTICLMAKASIFKEDGRKNNGGKREGAGRPKNQDENQDENQLEKNKNHLENNWGGKREGAGRPKTAENQQKKSSSENQINQINQTPYKNINNKNINIKHKEESVSINNKNIPPTLDEFLAWAKQQNDFAGVGGFKCSKTQAEQFWHHYSSQGWVTANNIPIANWQSKFREWCVKDKQRKDDLC